MQLINVHQYQAQPNYDAEYNSGEIVTIPDQNMSVPQIMENYKRGLPLTGGSRQSAYNGEAYIPNVDAMDIVDREAYLTQIKNERRDIIQSENTRLRTAREIIEAKADKGRTEVADKPANEV